MFDGREYNSEDASSEVEDESSKGEGGHSGGEMSWREQMMQQPIADSTGDKDNDEKEEEEDNNDGEESDNNDEDDVDLLARYGLNIYGQHEEEESVQDFELGFCFRIFLGNMPIEYHNVGQERAAGNYSILLCQECNENLGDNTLSFCCGMWSTGCDV